MGVLTTLREVRKEAAFALGIARRRPFQVLVQVTNRCNMRCSFCDFWPNGVARSQELDVADFARVSRELAGLGTFLVSIEGGEPTLRPDLVEIVRAFAAHHVPLLYTNGWYMDAALARALFAAGLVQVGVSIDFPDAARQDAKRGLEGGFERAWRAVELLRDAAPHGGRQVHVMSVVMQETVDGLDELCQMSAARGVNHAITLLSTKGFRRGSLPMVDRPPLAPVSARLRELWQRHPHLRTFRDYVERADDYLTGGELPRCRAGEASFNIDHVGNVSPCIEKIDMQMGNVRREPLGEIVTRMRGLDAVAKCQDCWTICRGFTQAMDGGGAGAWLDLAQRMRSR